MQIQINTDHNIEGHEALSAHVRAVVENALGRFSDYVTRVEVHLTDEVGHKSGQDDKRCVMEARLQGRQPQAVTQHAGSMHQAVDGAAAKLTKMLESTIGRMRDQKSRAAAPVPQEPQAPEE